jgi:hypothetical protein
MAITPTTDRTISQILASDPYFDDYDENKNFHRIIYRAGYPIQNRELIQTQTILQKQLERLGKHVFEEGSLVLPGEVTYDNTLKWIVVTSTDGLDTNVIVNIQSYIDTNRTVLITGATSGIVASLVGYIEGVSGYHVLYLKYLSGATENYDPDGEADQQVEFAAGESLSISFPDVTVTVSATIPDSVPEGGFVFTNYNNTTFDDVVSGEKSALMVSINKGVFFTHGNFVLVAPQQLIAEPVDVAQATCNVVLRVDESIVTEYDDVSLTDNASSEDNYTAPGAHRYKIDLTLTKTNIVEYDDETDDLSSADNTDTKYIRLLEFKAGVLQYILNRSEYAYLEDTLARRTYDESGDYTVRPFKIFTKVHDEAKEAETKYQIEIDPGKAYVKGYEIETIAKTTIENDRALDSKTDEDVSIPINYGNYVFVKNVRGLFNVNNPSTQSVSLYKSKMREVAITSMLDPSSGYVEVTGTDIGTGDFLIPGSILYSGDPKSDSDRVKVVQLNPNGDIPANPNEILVEVIQDAVSPFWASGTSSVNVFGVGKGTQIGSAKVRHILLENGANGTDDEDESGSTYAVYALYLYDINMLPGQKVEDTSIITNNSNFSCFVDRDKAKLSGSISIDSAKTITGFGTRFTSELSVGDNIVSEDGTKFTVQEVDDDFSLTIESTSTNVAGPIVLQSCYVEYADLRLPNKNLTIFPLPKPVIKSFTDRNNSPDYSYYVSYYHATLNVVSNRIELPETSIGSFINDFSDNNYIVSIVDAAPGFKHLNGCILDFSTSDFSFSGNNIIINNVSSAEVNGTAIGATALVSGTVSVISTVLCQNRDWGHKAPTAGSLTLTSSSDLVIPLNGGPGSIYYDVYEITQITLDGDDVTDKFELDTGCRDNYYAVSSLIKKPGVKIAAGLDLVITFNYYDHTSISADFFCVDSYPPDSYDDVPEYVSDSTGYNYSLTDYLDFRYKADDTSVYLVKPRTDFVGSYQYYLPRYDKLCLSKSGEFFIKKGTSAESPVIPEDPIDAMVLYILKSMAYTKDPVNHIIREYVENKRYTMKDIGRLEKRIDSVEYYTLLTLSEKDIVDMDILDAQTGLSRLKNGFIVDSFKDHSRGDFTNPDYKCSVDPEIQELRPSYYSDIVELKLDPTDTNFTNNFLLTGGIVSGVLTSDDVAAGSETKVQTGYTESVDENNIVMLKPTTSTKLIINQMFASRSINVNPFSVPSFWGKIKLIPDTDIWKDSTTKSPVYLNPDVQLDIPLPANGGETVWGEWKHSWTGAPTSEILDQSLRVEYWAETYHGQKIVSDDTGITGKAYKTPYSDNAPLAKPPFIRRWVQDTRSLVTTPSGLTRQGIKTSVNYATIKQDLGEKVVDVRLAETIRSRLVKFVAERMKPNTRVYPFFDGINVSQWCKPDYDQMRGHATPGETVNYGTPMVTDAQGKLIGYFNIPDPKTSPRKFKTGTRQFKLTSSSTNSSDSSNTTAFANYTASGVIETKQKSILSIRIPQMVAEAVVDNKIIYDQQTIVTSEPTTCWIDPIAETILITDDPGCFITRVDLWFTSKPSTSSLPIPVSIQIRNSNNGYPGPHIVPGTDVSKYPSEVRIIDVNSSSIGSYAYWEQTRTSFIFDMPVFLPKGEHALCVLSDSNSYEVLAATKSGQEKPDEVQFDYRTRQEISSEPYLGSMFKSQNGSTWTAMQESDLTFRIFKAQFPVGSRSFTMVNKDLELESLLANPFKFVSGSVNARVHHPNHGLLPGQYTTISGSTIGTGVLTGDLDTIDGNWLIHDVDHDNYVIVMPNQATASTEDGGDSVLASKGHLIDQGHIILNQMVLPQTDATYQMKMTDADAMTLSSSWIPTQTNKDFVPGQTYVVNALVNTPNPSAILNCTLTTNNTNLTPIIDLTRAGIICINNRIDDFDVSGYYNNDGLDTVVIGTDQSVVFAPSDRTISITYGSSSDAQSIMDQIQIGQYIKVTCVNESDDEITFNSGRMLIEDISVSGSNVVITTDRTTLVNSETYTADIDLLTRYIDEIAPTGGTAIASYVMKRVALEATSGALKVIFSAVRPPTCTIDLYYKLQRVDDIRLFDDIPYTKAETLQDVAISMRPDDYKEYNYEINNLPLFNAFSLKIVMRSGRNTTWMSPRIKELRAIALED